MKLSHCAWFDRHYGADHRCCDWEDARIKELDGSSRKLGCGSLRELICVVDRSVPCWAFGSLLVVRWRIYIGI